MAHKVFITNSLWDARTAEEVRSELERSGIRCWLWSRDVVEGLDFERQIDEAIEAAEVVVAILSEAAIVGPSSPHVLEHLELAGRKGSFVILFCLENIPHLLWERIVGLGGDHVLRIGPFRSFRFRRDDIGVDALSRSLSNLVYQVRALLRPMRSEATPGLSLSELLNARIGTAVQTPISRREPGAAQVLARAARRAEEERQWAEAAPRAEEERQMAEAARRAEEFEADRLPAGRSPSAPRPAGLPIWLFVALGLAAAYLFRHEIAALISAIAEFFHAKTSALPNNHVTVIAVASPESPSAEQLPRQDLVDVSAFAPEGGVAGSEVLVQVFLHRLDDTAIVEEWARAADPNTTWRGIATLVAEIARGKRVDILLEGRDTTIDEPLQSIVWRGEPCAVGFLVTLPDATGHRSCNLRVRILLDEVPIGSLRFALQVSAATPMLSRSVGIRGDTAVRYHRAFLSYATPDRPEVLKRAQALQAAHIEFFQDFLSIEPGERWERQLYSEIDLCDLFLLFWSTNAAQSEWVLREAELAVARQNTSPGEEPDITPIIVEGPPVPQPIPDFLRHLQFNDYLVYLIAATERERRATDLPQ